MKHPTLQKVMLAAMALVASLALSAQAGRPTLSPATQGHSGGKARPGHFPFSAKTAGGNLSPLEFIYMLDDGSAEDAIGLTLGGDIISLNEFAVVAGAADIDSVSIAWGTPAFPDPTLNGLPYTVAIWSDPNGDGSPTDAVLLTTAGGVVANQGTDTFITTNISASITTANFFVGFLITHSGGQFPAAFDETAPTFSNRSYVAGGASGNINDLNMNDLPVAPIESFGLVGNWLIRAHSSGTPSPTPTPSPTATPAGALWYNGDFNGVNGLANERDTSLGSGQFAQVFDDFNVNDAEGWDVHSVFSDNLENTVVVGATWEIRQGMSEGNGGTLVASGMTTTPNVVATGRSGFGFTEFMVEVTGLDVHLGPGSYHLNVTPTGNLTGRSFDSTTDGANCIGTPCGNNQNAFFNSNFFGANYTDTANFGQPYDFSMGVNGDVSGGGGGLEFTGAVSRRHHGSSGNFDIPLPGVDPRSGNGRMIVFSFSDDIASVGGSSVSCGMISSTSISGNTVTVNTNGACNAMDVDVTLTDVMGVGGGSLSSATATVSLLAGDVNGDRTVDRADVSEVRMNVGRGGVNDGNFRDDVTVDGHVNHNDVNATKAARGTSLP